MKYLKEIRQKNRFTQEQIARHLGISRPTYIKLEKEAYVCDLTMTQLEKLSDLYYFDSLSSFLIDFLLAENEELKSRLHPLEEIHNHAKNCS